MLLHTMQLVHSLKDFKTSYSSSSTLDPLQKIVSVAANRQGINVQAGAVSSPELYSSLEELTLPFLRSTVLFFQHFTDVAPGQDLVEDGGYTYEVLARCVDHGPFPPYVNETTYSVLSPKTTSKNSMPGTSVFPALCSSLLSHQHHRPFSNDCLVAEQLVVLYLLLLPLLFPPLPSTLGTYFKSSNPLSGL